MPGRAAQVVDVHAVGMVDELRARGVVELPFVVTSAGDSWSGLRLDKIVELRLALVDAACK